MTGRPSRRGVSRNKKEFDDYKREQMSPLPQGRE